MSTSSKAPMGATDDEKVAAYLTLDQIRKVPDLEPEDVHVPQWKGKVRVRPFSMRERQAVRKAAEYRQMDEDTGQLVTQYDSEEMEIEAVIQGCIEPRFSRADKVWLREEKSSGAITRIATKIFALSGMGRDAEGKQES